MLWPFWDAQVGPFRLEQTAWAAEGSLRNGLGWELESLQEELLSKQCPPVKYFKILSLPQFPCTSPLGAVSQAEMALLQARASSMAAARSQLPYLRIQHTRACKGCAKG